MTTISALTIDCTRVLQASERSQELAEVLQWVRAQAAAKTPMHVTLRGASRTKDLRRFQNGLQSLGCRVTTLSSRVQMPSA